MRLRWDRPLIFSSRTTPPGSFRSNSWDHAAGRAGRDLVSCRLFVVRHPNSTTLCLHSQPDAWGQSMSPNKKKIIKEILIVAGAFVALRYVASFSLPQSLVLIAIAYAAHTWVIDLLAETVISLEEGFDPFYIDVRPNWWNIMLDFKLVESEEEYRQLWDRVHEAPEWKYNLIRDGVRFIVLRPKVDDYKPALVYNCSTKCFFRAACPFTTALKNLQDPTKLTHTDSAGSCGSISTFGIAAMDMRSDCLCRHNGMPKSMVFRFLRQSTAGTFVLRSSRTKSSRTTGISPRDPMSKAERIS